MRRTQIVGLVLLLAGLASCRNAQPPMEEQAPVLPPEWFEPDTYQKPEPVADEQIDFEGPAIRPIDPQLTSGTTTISPPTAAKNGREAFVVVVRGGVKTPLNGTAAEDLALIKKLQAGYGKAGYNVHWLATIQTLDPLYSAMKKVEELYSKNNWTLKEVAIHLTGHGADKVFCCIPLDGTGKRVKVNGFCRSHEQIGFAAGFLFPARKAPFAATKFLAVFDACTQGKAVDEFPKGLKAGGQPNATGYVATSTDDKTCGVGVYSDGFALALATGATGAFGDDIKRGHKGGEGAALKALTRQVPQLQSF